MRGKHFALNLEVNWEARLVFITHEHFASLGLLLYLQCFRLSFHFVVSLAAVFPLWGGVLRDETKNDCESDFAAKLEIRLSRKNHRVTFRMRRLDTSLPPF